MENFKHLVFHDQSWTIEKHLDDQLKNKPPDCILYSQNGRYFEIHKDIFSQTNFLRKILSSAKEHCCEMLEILCPCTEEELGHLVYFLYEGEIQCKEKSDLVKIQKNLTKIFGFPKNLNLFDPNSNEIFIDDETDIDTGDFFEKGPKITPQTHI